jgi:uncharacterized protein involved in exopolysaccharide biosynthesis
VKEIEQQIADIKVSILEAAASLRNAKKQKITTLNQRFDTALNKLGFLPDKEKFYQDIARQKQIKEKLYMYLLQKMRKLQLRQYLLNPITKQWTMQVLHLFQLNPKQLK